MYKLCVKKNRDKPVQVSETEFYTCEAMHRKHLREHDQIPTLSSDIEKCRKKVRNFKN